MNKKIKENGVVFTPKYICDFMISFIENKHNSVFEPSCGEGIFIKTLIDNGYKNITANDINTEFIEKCKTNFTDVKFYNENFIDYDKNEKYDTIIGNPPYVRIQNLQNDLVLKMKEEYPELQGNTDLYIYFIIKCINMLKQDGKMIFIIPNSFLYNKSCKKVLNKLINDGLLEYVIDFREKKIFDGFSIYNCILVCNKKNAKERQYYNYSTDLNGIYVKIPYIKEPIKNSLLNYIDVKNGIATLCDNVYIIKEKEIIKEDNQYLYIEKDDKSYKIEKNIIQKILKVSKKEEYYIICPYTWIDGKAKIMDDLNEYPECEKYLLHYKKILEKRDKGTKKYEQWYAYGRHQGLDYNDTNRYFISNIVKNIKDNIYQEKIPLFYSGLHIIIKESNYDILQVIKDNEDKILSKSNIKSGGWYGLSKSSFDIEVFHQ